MAIFEGFLGRKKSDPFKDPSTAQSQSRADELNKKPQEPMLPNQGALEREAQELFVPKQKQPTTASAETKSQAEGTSYTGDAEKKEFSSQEAAMTKARTDVLDLLARIEKAGLPVSEKLRDAVKNELVNLASEAARVEFQEAERANPILILNQILNKLVEQNQLNQDISSRFVKGSQTLNENTDNFFKKFFAKQQEFIQKGQENPTNGSIIGNILRSYNKNQCPITSVVFLGFNNVTFTATEELLTQLAVYAGGQSIPLDDLFTAINNTGRSEPNNDLPYYTKVDNAINDLRSTLPQLKGLTVTVQKEAGDRGGFFIYIRGDASFWLRVVENAEALKKNT